MTKQRIPKPLSLGEETLARDLKAHKIDFAREWVFHPGRKWRFDFILHRPTETRPGIAVEVDGGLYRGRHTSPAGFENDCRKLNQAAIDGYFVLRYSTKMVTSGEAINQILEYLSAAIKRR